MVKNTLKAKIKQVLCREPVGLAYVYGSTVTGRAKRSRDIDVAVVAGPDSGLSAEELAVKLQKVIGRPEVDLRLIDLNSPAVFLRNILKDGVPVFVRSESERTEFEVRAMKKFYDSAYLRQFLTREMIGSIKADTYGRRHSHN